MALVDFCTRQNVKDQLEITNAASDTLIDALITAASRAINNRYDRELTPKTAAATRRFEVRSRLVDLAPYDLRTVTAVTLSPQDASPTTLAENVGYTLLPVGGSQPTGTSLLLRIAKDVRIETSFADRFGYELIDVAGAWGAWDTADIQEDVRRAAILTVGSWLDRAVAEYGVQGADDPRQIRPSRFAGWAIPFAAHALLMGAGIPRGTAV